MTEEIEAPDQDDDENEETLGEDFHIVQNDVEKMRERWMKMAGTLSPESGKLLQLLAGDLLPLLSDFTGLCGLSFDAVEAMVEENDDGDDSPRLSEQEATMVYMALLSGQQVLKALLDKIPEEMRLGIEQLIGTQEEALTIMRDTFGQELLDAADKIVQAAVTQ
jgi:hypothetical protein